jgi:hypothetical protein
MTARVRSIGPETDILVGLNVARLRDELGWDRPELSIQVRLRTGQKLSAATITTMEDPNKDRRISIGEMVVLAETFRVPLEELTREIG